MFLTHTIPFYRSESSYDIFRKAIGHTRDVVFDDHHKWLTRAIFESLKIAENVREVF